MTNTNGQTPEDVQETAVAPWKHLVRRRHPWRKQLYVKGRNMTARQLVGAMVANAMTEQETADDYRLPVDAVREALAYVEQDKELIEAETEKEQTMHQQGGAARDSQPVS
jgi:uncharacterized protein (DUF433 family)